MKRRYMKKIILIIAMLLMICVQTEAAETPEVCGNTYAFTYDTTTYIIKFTSSNPELPCTSGTATLYWSGIKKSYPFSIYNNYFADVVGLGKFAASGASLYLLDTTTIVFSLF